MHTDSIIKASTLQGLCDSYVNCAVAVGTLLAVSFPACGAAWAGLSDCEVLKRAIRVCMESDSWRSASLMARALSTLAASESALSLSA